LHDFGVFLVKRIEYRQLTDILALFLIVQLTGLLLAFYVISPAVVSLVGGGVSGSSDVVIYFAYMLVAAVIMVLLFRAYHGALLFKMIEGVVVAVASFYLFLIILASALPQDSMYPLPVSVLAAVGLVLAKNKFPWLRNFVAVTSSIGVGFVLGIYFSFPAAYALMALVAAYDYFAVFVTKHMITLGRETVNRNLAFMIGTYDVEVVPERYVNGKEKEELRREFSKTNSETLERLIKEGNVLVPNFSALGAGDLAIPLMLAISAYATYLSYFMSMLIVVGSAFGLIFAMTISKKYKIALPAIPPLFASANVAVGIAFLLLEPASWQNYVAMFAASAMIFALMLFTAKRQSKLGSAARINRTSS